MHVLMAPPANAAMAISGCHPIPGILNLRPESNPSYLKHGRIRMSGLGMGRRCEVPALETGRQEAIFRYRKESGMTFSYLNPLQHAGIDEASRYILAHSGTERGRDVRRDGYLRESRISNDK
jgi:hypothetical protein